MLLHDSTVKMLCVLRGLANDESGTPLSESYDIDIIDPDDAPLDLAIAEWAKAGCPVTERVVTVVEVLSVIREFAENTDKAYVLLNCYGINIESPDDAPLDEAISEWVEAGCPIPNPGCGHSACDGYTDCRGANAATGE